MHYQWGNATQVMPPHDRERHLLFMDADAGGTIAACGVAALPTGDSLEMDACVFCKVYARRNPAVVRGSG